MKRLGIVLATVAMLAGSLIVAPPAGATHHFWTISEVFAGTTYGPDVEFVELSTTFSGQQQIGGKAVTIFGADGESFYRYTFPENLGQDSTDRSLLIGSQAVVTAFGVSLDLEISDPDVIDGTGGRVCYGGTGSSQDFDCVSWGSYESGSQNGPEVPPDQSLYPLGDSYALASPSPRNFAGRAFPPPAGNGKIAFAGEGHIEVIEADGTGRITLNAASPASTVNEPAWNAIGNKLVFRKGGSSFSTMRDDGSNVKPLVTMPSFAGNPTWSPNGTLIAFDGFIGGINQENRIYTLPAAGGTARELVALDAQDPTFSPDGTKIAYEDSAGESDIGVMNADGSGATTITTGTGGNSGDFDPSWSPDGTKIAFKRAHQIWTVNANGSGAIQLTTGANASYPTWSPDGRKIAFERDADIWVMNTDGSDTTNITNTQDVDEREPDWGVFVEAKVPSTTTLTVGKTPRRIEARGSVSPPHSGLTVSVTLFKKRGARFVNIGTKKPALTSESKYSASFGRPSSGTCKLKARFPGDSDHPPSAVSKTFKC